MVQIKRIQIYPIEDAIFSFISHMVQIKLKKIIEKTESLCNLYPTWFR